MTPKCCPFCGGEDLKRLYYNSDPFMESRWKCQTLGCRQRFVVVRQISAFGGDEAPYQELSPTEHMANQCDGCKAGIPVDDRGIHRMSDNGDGFDADIMLCQRYRYAHRVKGETNGP